ncbi:MAG: ATP-binding protein [Desulfuromonadaceae bacterium]
MDASDYQKIRQLFDDYIRMYSSRDDELTSHFSEDFSGITGSGDYLIKDREAWITVTRQDFAQVKDPINIELKDLAIQLLADTIAVATSTINIHLPIEEHVLSRKIVRLVLIFRDEPTGWKISHCSYSVSFGVAGEDEIFPLKDLEERNRFLEEQVAERTAQLSEANAKLQRTNEVLAIEIAEHKQAEEHTIDAMNYIQTILSTSPVGMGTYKATGEYVSANEAAARIVGGSIGQLMQQNFRDIESWRRFGLLEFAERALATGIEQRGDFHIVTTFGKEVDIDVLFVPFMFGGEQHLMHTLRDITEQKKHEKEQLKMEKLESLGLLAGGIAHDFNNILTGVMGNISFAQMFLDSSHKSYKPLVEAEKASKRATELAQQLLTFARGGEPIRKVISLQQIANETVELVLRGSNVKGIVQIPDSIHSIDADEGQMSQVLHNIIINATQAMPGGGTLTASAQNETLADNNTLYLPPGRYVRLTISDQGCGIPDDVMKRIFDPYFTTKSAGNGLGLASAHSIINRHGGRISARSTAGEGTTFTIHLPSIGETYSEYQADSVTQDVGDHPGGSILVMDDEEMIRDMTTEMLEYLGYQATTCASGAEAVTRYKAAGDSGTPFSAVIMDLTIPGGMGGKDAAEQILAIDPQARLIVSSGYSNDPIMSDYRAYGFTGAVAKPYNIKELSQLIRDLLSV